MHERVLKSANQFAFAKVSSDSTHGYVVVVLLKWNKSNRSRWYPMSLRTPNSVFFSASMTFSGVDFGSLGVGVVPGRQIRFFQIGEGDGYFMTISSSAKKAVVVRMCMPADCKQIVLERAERL